MFSPKVARRLRSIAVGLLAGLLVVFIYVAFLMRTTEQPAQDVAPPSVLAPSFNLIDQNGHPFTDDNLRGKVWVADLTNAYCPDDCITLTDSMNLLRDRLRAQGLLGHHVMLVSFSAHPLVDTVHSMEELAAAQDANPDEWRFLTGEPAYLDDYIGANFFLPIDVLPFEQFGTAEAPPYAIVRSNRFVLVDRNGHVRNYYGGDRLHIDREMELLLDEIQQIVLEN